MTPCAGRRAKRIAIAIVFIVTLVVYLPALYGGFVYDDVQQVLGNPWILDLNHLSDILLSPSWAFENAGSSESNFFRPILHIFFLVEYHIFGFTPWAFHLVNIVMHSLNAVMVFLLSTHLMEETIEDNPAQGAERLWIGFYFPVLSALIFALHPINTEVVSWVSATPELSYTLFLLGALYLYVKYASRAGIFSYLSALLFFLSLLSKETAMSYLIFIWAYDYSKEGKGFIKDYIRYLPFLVATALYMAMRLYAMGALLNGSAKGAHLYTSMLNGFVLITRYLTKIIWPVNLSVIYSVNTPTAIGDPFVILSIGISVLVLSALVALRKRGFPFFSFIWIFIPLTPVLYAPVLSAGGFAERYLYLPSAGFAMLCSYALLKLYGKGHEKARPANGFYSKRVILIYLVSALLLSSYIITVEGRVKVWQSDVTLWTDTVAKTHGNTNAHYNLAWALQNSGDIEGARLHYRESIRFSPNNADAHYNLGLIYIRERDYASAVREFRAVVEINANYKKAKRLLERAEKKIK